MATWTLQANICHIYGVRKWREVLIAQEQCDQMVYFIFKYLAIYIHGYLPNVA